MNKLIQQLMSLSTTERRQKLLQIKNTDLKLYFAVKEAFELLATKKKN